MTRLSMLASLVVLAVMTAGAGGPAPADYPKKITYVPAEKRLKTIGKNGAPPQGGNELIPRDMDLGVRASMGNKPPTPPAAAAVAEVHSTFGHVFLIDEGEGTLVLGGQLVDEKE